MCNLFALKEEVFRLVRFDNAAGYRRRVMDDVGGDNAQPEDEVAFPDLFPLLLTTRESLEEVNRRVPGMDVAMERFRPNIVVSGSPAAFDEDAPQLPLFHRLPDGVGTNGVVAEVPRFRMIFHGRCDQHMSKQTCNNM